MSRSEGSLVARAQALQKQSLLRSRVFGGRSAMFRDPAWFMLLEAYVSEAKRENLLVKGLCGASGVPPTTALRFIALLEEAGLLQRERNGHDRRSVLVQLTDVGRCLVDDYLEADVS